MRSTTLWSTEPANEDTAVAGALRQGGTPAFRLMGDDAYRRRLQGAQDQLPRIMHTAAHEPLTVPLANAAASIDVHRVRTWLFAHPYGGYVAGLTLDYSDLRGLGVAPLPELFADVDAGRWGLSVEGRPLIEACLDDLPDLVGLRLGADMHHLTFISPGPWTGGAQLDRQLLMALVSRRDAPSRDEFLTARFPAEPNRFHDGAAAVTPGATAAAVGSSALELTFVLCAVQAMASLSSLRQIQRRAYSALSALRGPEDTADLDWLAYNARRLSELELDLSFGVEAHLEMRLLVPSLPVEQYHRELVDTLGLARGARVTGTMLARLSTAIEAERTALSAGQRDADERRFRREEERERSFRWTSGLVALVAVPLTLIFGFLGANTSQLRNSPSIWSSEVLPFYAALLGVVALAASLGYALARLRARQSSAPEDEPSGPTRRPPAVEN